MKNITTGAVFMLIFTVVVASCKKDRDQVRLALLKHKWSVVSLNGEALRYVGRQGDYFEFRDDTILVEFVNGKYDTSAYSLSSNGQTLDLYSIKNGVRSDTTSSFDIQVLSTSSLVLNYSLRMPPIFISDSLSR